MKILNCYAGIGGNRKKWDETKHQITAIEIDPKIANVYSKLYPNDKVIVGDAHEYLVKNYNKYDFIWSSPPCQSHSKTMFTMKEKKYPDMALYQEILFLSQWFKGLYVIENVKPYYEPLIKPSYLLQRHFLWCNFFISNIEIKSPPNFINADTTTLKKWLGIYYEETLYYENNHNSAQVLRNCVHPDLGLHILNNALNIHDEKLAIQYKKQLSFEDLF